MSSYDNPVCDKCGEPMPMGEDMHQRSQCPYLRCADPACRCLREPRTQRQLELALLHWRYHVRHVPEAK